jgi:hypothetical protein
LPESIQQPRFCHPWGAERVAAALEADEVVEETVVEEEEVEVEVAEVEILEEVAVEVALDEEVEEATEAVVTELSPIAWNAVRRHEPPHFEYMSPAQATLQSDDATSLAVDR